MRHATDCWLKPGTPSIRAIQLWTGLHAFEYMQLVIDYLSLGGHSGQLAFELPHGYPRLADDPCIERLRRDGVEEKVASWQL